FVGAAYAAALFVQRRPIAGPTPAQIGDVFRALSSVADPLLTRDPAAVVPLNRGSHDRSRHRERRFLLQRDRVVAKSEGSVRIIDAYRMARLSAPHPSMFHLLKSVMSAMIADSEIIAGGGVQSTSLTIPMIFPIPFSGKISQKHCPLSI